MKVLSQNFLNPASKWLVLSLFILGIFFRFGNIDSKVYWHDEVYTSLRISGYNGSQFIERVFDGSLQTPEDILQFQYPSSERDLKDVIIRFMEHAEHPPLYYLIAHFWVKKFGSSVATIRSLSAIFGILLLPASYWLSWELFKNYTLSGLVIALISISPFHVLYAQEARQYSLLSLTITLTTATLLHGMKTQKKWVWGMYTIALTTAFYTSFLSVFVAISYTLYIVIIEKLKWTKNLRNFLLFSSISFLLFLPWLWVLILNFSQVRNQTAWVKVSEPFGKMITLWGLHLTALFFDTGLSLFDIRNYFAIAILWIFVIYGFYILIKETPRKIWLLLLLLVIIPAAAIVIPDIILGGRRSIVTRYFTCCYVGIQMAIPYLFATRLFGKKFFLQTQMWRGIFAAIIISAIVSCTISFEAEAWWNKANGINHVRIADIINRSERPLLISSLSGNNTGEVIVLSYLLKPEVRLLLVTPPKIPQIPTGFSDIFIFNPSPKFLKEIEGSQEREVKPVYY